MTVWGVGIVGAGAAAQGIHVPSLARLNNRFVVRGVFDVDDDLRTAVAATTGAESCDSFDALLADPAIDVICICSPERFHADQVIGACMAEKRAVMCEKPLATTVADAERIAAVSRETGVPVLVGTMHRWDPVWREASALFASHAGTPTIITSSIVIPGNALFEDLAADIRRPGPAASVVSGETPGERIRRRLLLLSIHDLPLMRPFLDRPDDISVIDGGALEPIGYHVSGRAGSTSIRLIGSMRDHWEPKWKLRIADETHSLDVTFPPAFVHAGSAVAVVTTPSGTRSFPTQAENGYVGEWRELDRVLRAGELPDPSRLVEDLAFAVAIADRAAATVTERSIS